MGKTITAITLMIMLSTAILSVTGCAGKAETPGEKIDWADFIKFNGILYIKDYQDVPYSEDDLEYFGVTEFRTDDVRDRGYQIKDGDAAYLDEGTKIYSVKGYSPDFRLVAESGGTKILFEATENPDAKTGADLLDIGGKAAGIRITTATYGENGLASITDTDMVTGLVGMVLKAPVDQSDYSGSQRVRIEFQLEDGTTVNRIFLTDSGRMGGGIMLPAEFWETIKPFVQDNPEIDGSQWSLVEIGGKEIIEGSYISLYFRNWSVQGSAGCNGYGSSYSSGEPGVLKIDDLVSTLAGCDSPEGVLEQEQDYLQKLGSTASYCLSGDKLELYDSGDEKLLVFERIPEYAMDPADLIGTDWECVSINGEPIIEGLSIDLKFTDDNEAVGSAGAIGYVLFYEASGDDINWGNSITKRKDEFPEETGLPGVEEQALRYTDILTRTANYRLDSGRLELYTSEGNTLVYEPVDGSADS